MKRIRVLSYLTVLVLVVVPLYGVPAADEGDPSAKSAEVVTGGNQAAPRVPEDALFEGFEGGIVPPVGWTVLSTNPNETWQIYDPTPHSGAYYATVLYDPALLDQDEILLSSYFSATAGSVDFWSFGSIYWCRDTYDNCDLEVWFVRGGWGGGDDAFLGLADGDWADSYAWSSSAFDFSAYADGSPARIAFRYVGNDGAQIALDDITINYSTDCSDPHEPNNGLAEATAISYGQTVTDAEICPAGDEDYYVFSGNADDAIVVDIDAWSLDPASMLDSYLYLLDSTGSVLAFNDDDDGYDSRIEYTLPADGTYYLKVREYNHPDAGGPEYYYVLSLYGPSNLALSSYWSVSPPNIDGIIGPAEWADAAAYDITTSASTAQLEAGDLTLGNASPDQGSAPEASRATVTLYVKNDGTHLYLAFDNPNDTVPGDFDEAGIYFDDNPLPSDGQWTNTACGNPDGEGNFWVGAYSSTVYREIIAGPTGCDFVDPAPGLDGTLEYTSGHVQLEVAIDLTSSALRALPGDSIGMYLWILDGNTEVLDGACPLGADSDDPSTYAQLTLANLVQRIYLPLVLR